MVELQTNVTSAIYNFVNNHRNNVHSTILLHYWLDDYLSLNHIWAIVGEPKSRIVQKHTFFAPERYTAGILYTDSLKSAWYKTTV